MGSMYVDLHMHSTASDGTVEPGQLGRLAADAGLFAIALTDHDTVAGLAACHAGCRRAGVQFVEGIELSCDRGKPHGNMHLLGYFVNAEEPRLLGVIEDQHEARQHRNPLIIEKLNALGVDITLEEVLAQADGATVGRPHIAQVLVNKGYAKTINDAFSRYIGLGAPAYARKDRLDPIRAIDAIHAAGGLAVLAHPVQLDCEDDRELESVVRRLQTLGLDGLEAYHSDHTADHVQKYRQLAQRLGLLITGGSDFHGSRKNIAMGHGRVPREVYDQLLESYEMHGE